ncbi:Na/Pi cotransporter family protein [Xylanibacillus composti]|uniref:Phosphate:Na+ symporter n=1 Tax=Xylanibacillus composti TaxID=1572762 RepID=A0A8J4H4Y2_9BACL|nr:Na/Pi symporter [Xylanibacillus composti]MDT9724439.1 Na/Pi cotransporter family protein [Xylanibacillus composti]GIQ69701.1 hypothetical protein XYCOK13_25250 [Xylanibacillus composti]
MMAELIFPLAAGLAMFLFGMKVMELALHTWAGAYLKNALGTFTSTPLRGMVAGTVLTAVVQSSSAITVITIGLVNAGMLTFPRTLGIILGTNIGTCLTTELLGLNLNHAAVPMLIGSSAVWLIAWMLHVETDDSQVRVNSHGPMRIRSLLPTRRIVRRSAEIRRSARMGKVMRPVKLMAMAAAGFSCILLGMQVMGTIVPALHARGLFAWFLELSQAGMLWGIAAGTGITAIIQSSSAAVAIVMGLAAVQAITPELAIAMVLGANIGTCVTGLLAAIGGTRAGKMVAWAQVVLNVAGTLLFLPFIPLLAQWSGALAANPASQIAHAQTIFNIACSLLALPLCYLPWLRLRTR